MQTAKTNKSTRWDSYNLLKLLYNKYAIQKQINQHDEILITYLSCYTYSTLQLSEDKSCMVSITRW